MATFAENMRAKLAREMSLTTQEARQVTPQEIKTAIDVAMGRASKDVAYGEKPLAGGLDIGEVGGIPINATDLIGTGIPSKIAIAAKSFAPAMMAALAGTAIASKASQGAKFSALANVLRKERGIFAGVNAKTADLAALERAKQMQSAGVPDAEIWPQTGWALDTPDKMPRFEIPDDTAKQLKNAKKTGMIDLEDWIAHPELQAAYPRMFDREFAGMRGEGGILAMAEPGHKGGEFGWNMLKVAGDTKGESRKSTTLHELQHSIQQREGFARGGSPDTSAGVGMTKDNTMEYARKAYEQSHQTSGDPLLEELLGGAKKWEELTPREQLGWIDQGRMSAYRNLAGEAEARLTQARMNLTPEQRLAQYPYAPEYFRESTGVNLDDLIVRKDGGTAMSVDPLFDTIGLPDRGRELIQSKAEEYAQKMRDAGVNVMEVTHSGSAAGPSSYIKVAGQPDIRISGHSKGVFNTGGVINIGSDDAFNELLGNLPKTVRKATQEDYSRLKQQEIDTMYPIRLKSADKKIQKGKALTISEQEAVDWRNSQMVKK